MRPFALCAVALGAALVTASVARPAAAVAPVGWGTRAERGFDSTFIQINDRELAWEAPEWTRALGTLRTAGVRLVVLQFSGAGGRSYDAMRRGEVGSVTALLAAASAIKMPVFVGLWADARWPSSFPDGALPQPLDDPAAAKALGEACAASPAFAGWYVPEEIDYRTFGVAGAPRLRGFLARTSAALKALVEAPVAIAPFYTGALDPRAHARWWRDILDGAGVDVLILQDGVGVKRATPAKARRTLDALWPVTRRHHVRLWSAIELFEQIHGPPVDEQPFAASPAPIEQVLRSLGAERAQVERVVAFAVLSYMDPSAGARQAELYRRFLAWRSERRVARRR